MQSDESQQPTTQNHGLFINEALSKTSKLSSQSDFFFNIIKKSFSNLDHFFCVPFTEQYRIWTLQLHCNFIEWFDTICCWIGDMWLCIRYSSVEM